MEIKQLELGDGERTNQILSWNFPLRLYVAPTLPLRCPLCCPYIALYVASMLPSTLTLCCPYVVPTLPSTFAPTLPLHCPLHCPYFAPMLPSTLPLCCSYIVLYVAPTLPLYGNLKFKAYFEGLCIHIIELQSCITVCPWLPLVALATIDLVSDNIEFEV